MIQKEHLCFGADTNILLYSVSYRTRRNRKLFFKNKSWTNNASVLKSHIYIIIKHVSNPSVCLSPCRLWQWCRLRGLIQAVVYPGILSPTCADNFGSLSVSNVYYRGHTMAAATDGSCDAKRNEEVLSGGNGDVCARKQTLGIKKSHSLCHLASPTGLNWEDALLGCWLRWWSGNEGYKYINECRSQAAWRDETAI